MDYPPPHLASLAYAYGKPTVTARYRQNAVDFRVVERLSFELSGSGEHVYLCIEKRNFTTEDVVRRLIRFAGVRKVDVGYAGLKDRNALTLQWFSVNLSGREEPDWARLQSSQIKILEISRHAKKLQRGALAGNDFTIILRDVASDNAGLENRLMRIAKQGVPNYFGEQRFGRQEKNLRAAHDLLINNRKAKNRHLRGLYFSAARAFLFNVILSRRVEAGQWGKALPGDAMILDGSRSFFTVDEVDETIRQRVQQGDIHPSAPLWGLGAQVARGEALRMEQEALAPYADWCRGLQARGLKTQPRSLRLMVHDLEWEWLDASTLKLSFRLPAGAYATSVLREVILPAGDS